MYTKSTIHQIREGFEIANNFRNSLNDIMEKYTIEDSVFIFRNNQLFEATSGYFECCNEYDNIMDAVRDCYGNYNTMGIRVIDNKTFETGKIYKTISECNHEKKILDIDCLSIC